MLITIGLLMSINLLAANYAVTATRELSKDNKTSKWSSLVCNNSNYIQGTDITAEGDGLYFESNGAKITLNGDPSQCNIKANAIMYVEVPSAGAAGTILFTGSNNKDRLLTTNTGTKINNFESAKFTSDDIIPINNGYYIKLKSESDFKFGTVTVTITNGDAYPSPLDQPTISIDLEGNVTITTVPKAIKTVYTTDGTIPTETNGTEYTASFKVEDGITVKAVSIGNGKEYSNSSICSKQFFGNITVAAPTFTVINGTVAINTTTIGAKIQYSTDGSTYKDYTYPITFLSNGTIYAKATREGSTDSGISSATVSVIPAKEGTSTKILGFNEPSGTNNWEYMTSNDKKYGIKGKKGTEEDGWSLWISPNSSNIYDKDITADASKNSTYQINGTAYKYIKNSNGRQINIGLPTGIYANRITIYGFNNKTPGNNSLWSNVGGTEYTTETEIPLANTSGADPYIRVFTLNNITENIAINNKGEQQCFIVAIDYKTLPIVTLNGEGYATFSCEIPVSINGANAYTATVSDNKIVCSSVADNKIPAYSGVLIYGEPNAAVTLTHDATANTLDASNQLMPTTTAEGLAPVTSALVLNGNTFMQYSGSTFLADKAYLPYTQENVANSMRIVIESNPTNAKAVEAKAETRDTTTYNIAGQRVSPNAKGLIITGGKKFINN